MRAALETKLPYPVHLSFDERTARSIVENKAVHLLAYETKNFRKSDYDFTQDLRKLGFSSPALILAEELKFDQFYGKDDNKLFFLPKPFDPKAFVGVTRKLMVSRTITQQRHKRFPTQQTATMETFLSGEVLPSQIYNLSMGGAYCEFFGKTGVSVGDLVKLKVQLEDLGTQYVMNAKIVWITRSGSCTGGQGAGMRFVKYDDIYRQLMEKV